MAKSLSNVRVAAQSISTEIAEGEETLVAYLQLTAGGKRAYENDAIPDKGMTVWVQLDSGSYEHLGIKQEKACLFGKLYADGGDHFKEGTLSLFISWLDQEVDSIPVGRLAYCEDKGDEAIWRGIGRGPLEDAKQIVIRVEDYEGEEWLALYRID
jgi:hypothetical protein